MFKYFLLLLVALPSIFALDNFVACKNNGIGVLPDYVNIKDCDTAPCHITEGDFMIADSGLTVPHATSNLTVALHAYKFGIRIDIDLDDDVVAACDHIDGGKCPLKGGEKIVYNFAALIEGIPSDNVKVQVEFALRNDKGKNMSCVRFDAIVHKPTHKYAGVPRS